MDINVFMQHQVDLLARIADSNDKLVALVAEQLEGQTFITGQLVDGTAGAYPIGEAKIIPADTPTEEANEIARKSASDIAAKQAAAVEAAAAKTKADAAAKVKADAAAKVKADTAAKEKAEADAAAAKAEAGAAAAGASKTPKLSVDDVRVALKAYAAIEGNEAAMALLTKFEAASVSALDAEKYADFIAACK